MAETEPPDDVQFLDQPEAPEAAPESNARRLPGAAVVPFGLAVAGAALAVVAPFPRAYSIRLPSFDGNSVTLAPDGWGRATGGLVADNGQHGPRIGIVLCAAAGIALVGLVLWLLPTRRVPRALGSAAMILAAGASLAGAAAVVLIGSATADSYRAALRANGARFRPDAVAVSFSWTVWLGVAAAVSLIAAVIVRSTTRPAEVQATDLTATSTERDASIEPLL